MSKFRPNEETLYLDPDEDIREQLEDLFVGAITENDLYRLLNGCGFQVLPIVSNDERVNAPTSERYH